MRRPLLRTVERMAQRVPTRLLDRLLREDSIQALSVREAAKLLGVAPSTVWRRRQRQQLEADEHGVVYIRKTYGADGRWRPGRRIPQVDRTLAILRLRHQGESMHAIADEVGCSASTVHHTLSRIPEGLPPVWLTPDL